MNDDDSLAVGVMICIYEMTDKKTWDWSVDFADTSLSQKGRVPTFHMALECTRGAFENGIAAERATDR